jgi:hypothetical protein
VWNLKPEQARSERQVGDAVLGNWHVERRCSLIDLVLSREACGRIWDM